jgi:putative glutamine amidotransferase
VSRPRVGIPADSRMLGPHPFDAVGRKYTRAVAEVADCLPLLIPVADSAASIAEILEAVDGLFFPGSPSNLHPGTYGLADAPVLPDKLDPERDALTLPLLRAAIASGKPLFAVCRGLQELNVALGGTLHQAVHAVPGYADHREDNSQPLAEQYAPAHSVKLSGWFRDTLQADEIQVNSLHGQGLNHIADGLVAEAWASDGLIEGVRGTGPGFAIGVQWHPEWQAANNPHSVKLFHAFGEACRCAP